MQYNTFLFFLFAAFSAISCNTVAPENAKKQCVDTLSREPQPQNAENVSPLPAGFEWFESREQIVYCLPLPLHTYAQDTKNRYERGEFLFKNKKNNSYELHVQGFFRTENASLSDYKTAYLAQAEEDGKRIDTQKEVTASNCFYIKGGYGNIYDKQRFIDIVWLRPDECVKFSVDYTVADTTVWDKWLPTLTACAAKCSK